MRGLPLVHRASILGTATTRSRGTAKGRRFWRIDDVNNQAGRIQTLRIYRQSIVGVHAKRCGVDHYFEILWIAWASRCSATSGGSDGLCEVVSATFVNIRDGECPGARRGDCKGNGSAGAPRADQENGLVCGAIRS